MRRYTLEELSQYHGKDGASALIACGGKVYDVTQSYFWRGGLHWASHIAGQDLTQELALAPHGADMLRRVPVVGILISGDPS